jgi:hypothetical protein
MVTSYDDQFPVNTKSPNDNFSLMKNSPDTDTLLGNELNTQYLDGHFGDVYFFDKYLSNAEITELFNGRKELDMTTFSAYANLKRWWTMGDTVGDDDVTGVVVDRMGSGQDLTLVNGPTFANEVP